MRSSSISLSALCCVALAAGLGTPALAETAVETVVRSGDLTVIVYDDGAPFLSNEDGSYKGLAMEFADAIRQELEAFIGKPISVAPLPVTTVKAATDALLSGDAQLACGSSYSWERSLLVDHTIPFATGGIRVLTLSDVDGTPDSLRGEKIGVVKDSYASIVLQGSVPEASFVMYDNGNEAFSALQSEEIQILGGDSLWLKHYQEVVDSSGQIMPEVPYARSSIGCIIPENNSTLLNYSNIAIAKLMQRYINEDPDAQSQIHQWIGPGSTVDIEPEQIVEYFGKVLSTTAPIAIP